MNAIGNNIKIGFWQLISNITKIEIPIMQRDYAQGRNDEKTKKIRSLFLDSLLKAIESDKESIELDFVYGDIKNGVFQPLDGQQRLTTLFLLYWYIAYKTGNLSENKKLFKKFTYETRISSREFCIELAENGENLGKDGSKSIQEQIVDSSWFFLSWKKDPTIKAMLVMLNSIESKLKEKPREFTKIWEKLISENPLITFHFKQLNDIGLTDDLYIKMNARGKQITDFENFKARFEKYIKENEFERDISLTETFSHKIDTVWTDLFWKYRGDDNLVDNKFDKFIADIAINSYAENQEIFKSENEDKLTRKSLEENKEKNITDEKVKRKRIEDRIKSLSDDPNKIMPEDFPTKTSFEYLKSCFEIYSNKGFKYDELKPKGLKLWNFVEIKNVKINSEQELDNNLFLELEKDEKTEYKQRVLFYAQTIYLLKLKSETFNSTSFNEWMRVCRNIVQNATIDSAGTYIGAIGLINELSKGCKNIYQYLNEVSIESKFASSQVKEEIIKAKIIFNVPDAKSLIHKTEDTNFCKGKIGFPLYCSGYDIENDTFSKFDINKLGKTLVVINDNFSILNKELSGEFKRAFLTIKGNDYYKLWWKWSYSFQCYKGKLLKIVGDLKNSFAESSDWKREYLKELFVLLWSHSFEQIIDEYNIPNNMPKWKQRLIKEQDLLKKEVTFILIPKSNAYCKLAKQQRPSREEQVTTIE